MTARPQVRIDKYGRVWAKGASEIFSADADDWIDGWCVADADAVVVDDAFVAQFASAAVLTDNDVETLARMMHESYWPEDPTSRAWELLQPAEREFEIKLAREVIRRLIAARDSGAP